MQNQYLVALVCVNAYFLAIALFNIIYFRRATNEPHVTDGPFVSVIVPARDEQRSVRRCLESLLAQDYADYEVIVVDDESSDATAAILAGLSAHDARLRTVCSGPLPDGWLGKPHAMSKGVEIARGEILLLTDADTVHDPRSISWAVTNLQAHHADILSGYLKQEYGSFGESIVVPTMYAMMLLTPFALVAREKAPRASFAIGQYVAIRRAALDGVGGYEAIRNSIVDDMAMAARMKRFGYQGVFLDASDAASCRLYTGYRDAFVGIERSIYSSVGANLLTVLAMTVIVIGLIVWPALAVLSPTLRFGLPIAPFAASAVLFATQWALITWNRRTPVTAFMLYPLVFFNLILILYASVLSTGFGSGVSWKGRRVRIPRSSDPSAEAGMAEFDGRSGKVR